METTDFLLKSNIKKYTAGYNNKQNHEHQSDDEVKMHDGINELNRLIEVNELLSDDFKSF